MSIISRYILRNHVGPFLFGTLTVTFLFFFQFLLKVVDQLLGKGLSEWVIIHFFIVNLAWMVVLAVPMGVLFSTLMAFGGMSAMHEITVIKASGGSLIRMMIPVIISGALLTVALFWFNDEVLPEANHKAKILMSDIKRTKPTLSIESGKFTTALSGYTILAREVDSISGLMRGVTIYDNTEGNYENIVSADSGTIRFNSNYTKLILDLRYGELHQSVPFSMRNYRKVDYDRYKINIDASGFAFEQSGENVVSRGDREMHIRDMQEIVDESMARAKEASGRLRKKLDNHFEFLMTGVDIRDSLIKAEEENRKKWVQPKDTIAKILAGRRIRKLRDSALMAQRTEQEKLLRKKKTPAKGSSLKPGPAKKIKKTDTAFSRPGSKQPVKKVLPKSTARKHVSEIENKQASAPRKSASLKKCVVDSAVIRDSIKMVRSDEADTSKLAVMRKLQKRVSFLRSELSSDVFQQNDYYARVRQYEVEIYKKYAIPFACLIFVFVGCPLGIMTKGGNFGLSAAISLGFYILYWACLIMGEKLADRGIMSPFLSMWMGNFIIGFMGIILTLRVNNESFRLFGITNFFRRKKA